jgi:hypothetical protein
MTAIQLKFGGNRNKNIQAILKNKMRDSRFTIKSLIPQAS